MLEKDIKATHSEQAYSIPGDLETASNQDAMTSPALFQHRHPDPHYHQVHAHASYRDPEHS